jgi:Transposase, Mutator family
VAARVSPTEAIRAEIHELFASDGELLSVLEQVARLSVRLTFQSVVEEIVCEELGRDRYQRRREDSPEGYRNGWHQPRTLKTAAGPVQLQRPKLRHAHAALCDQLFGAGVSRTNALETLVISCWVRGLSDRDVEAMLVEVFGQDATISRTTSAGSVSGCGPSSTPGVAATSPRPRSTTCTWTGRSSRCTPRPGPSRCWPPGASTPTDTRCSSALGRGCRVDRRLARVPGGPGRPGAWRPAAGHLRRRQGPVRGDRVGIAQ